MAELEYLDDFEALTYNRKSGPERVELRNLKDMGGMEVAELLTYLYDDGFSEFGPMSAKHENGALTMMKTE